MFQNAANISAACRPCRQGVDATHSNADFAKDLLGDLASLLQRLVQGAPILQAELLSSM